MATPTASGSGLKALAQIRRNALKLLDTDAFHEFEISADDVDKVDVRDLASLIAFRGRGNRQRYFRRPSAGDDALALEQLQLVLLCSDTAAALYGHLRKSHPQALDDLVLRCLWIGSGATQAGILKLNPTYEKGRRQLQRPDLMRRAKANAAPDRRRENRAKAEAAVQWARKKYPTADYDGDDKTIMEAAAKHLGKHVSTLYRWLGK